MNRIGKHLFKGRGSFADPRGTMAFVQRWEIGFL